VAHDQIRPAEDIDRHTHEISSEGGGERNASSSQRKSLGSTRLAREGEGKANKPGKIFPNKDCQLENKEKSLEEKKKQK